MQWFNFQNDKSKTLWIFGIVGMFILINTFLIVAEFFWFPIIIGIILALILAFFSADILLYLILFLTPLSVVFKDNNFNAGLSIPSEPLMILLTGVFIFRILYENSFDFKITKHPVSIAIFVFLIWLFFTSIISELPLVSFKFLASKLWFIIPFYFMLTQLLKKNKVAIRNFFWAYSLGLCAVVIYTTVLHSTYGFNEVVGHWIMSPFYNDHTAYGAALAFYIPILFGLFYDNSYSRSKKLFVLLIFIVIFIGLYLSYSRAAWLGVTGAFAMFLIMKFRIKFYWIFAVIILLVGFFFMFENEIINKMSKNKQDSSKNLVEHIESISNISTDDSNLERINRWAAAIRMFKKRPFTGWGPGTYQFVYAPFQYSYEKTLISTNAGDKGTAHSEYIGPLAETGIPGLITFLAIVILAIYTSAKVYYKSKSQSTKTYSMIALASLVTYLIHGFLNNFLDTDKLAVPFWGTIALIVVLDVYYLRNEEKLSE